MWPVANFGRQQDREGLALPAPPWFHRGVSNRWGKIMSGEKKMLMRMFNVGTLAALLTACGESADEAYVRGYDEGYIDGQYEVCTDLEIIAPELKARLQDCDGYY